MNKLIQLAQNGQINADASIRDTQSIIIHAHVQHIWEVLTSLSEWPQWNNEVHHVSEVKIAVNAHFQWQIGKSKYTSTFCAVKPHECLSWVSKGAGIKSIQVWRLERIDEHETVVTTSQSLQGVGTLFYNHRKLHSTLLNWLDCLKAKCGPNA